MSCREMSNKILSIENLTVEYDKHIALRNVTIDIDEHDFVGITGPNGGGKSTLLKSILGLVPSHSGNIIHFRNGQRIRQLRMGYMPQYNNVDRRFPITVEEVIRAGQLMCCNQTHSDQKHKEMLDETLDRLNLTDLRTRSIEELSGGQLQRTLLGRAIITQPEILLLDEPDTYLDHESEKMLYNTLHSINSDTAIVLVSHDAQSLYDHCTRIACVAETLHYHK